MWDHFDPGQSFPCSPQKTISITVLRLYDFVRLSIVISFQIMFSSSTHEWHPYNQIYVWVRSDPSNLIALQPLKNKFLNCKINARTGFLYLKTWVKTQRLTFYHKYKGSYGVLNILFIWLIWPLYLLRRWQKSCSRVLEWHFSDSRSYDMSSKWYQVWYVK